MVSPPVEYELSFVAWWVVTEPRLKLDLQLLDNLRSPAHDMHVLFFISGPRDSKSGPRLRKSGPRENYLGAPIYYLGAPTS